MKTIASETKDVRIARIVPLLVAIVLTCSLACAWGASSALAKGSLLGNKGTEGAEAFEWTEDPDCSKCHVKQAESVEKETLLISKHASLDCLFCHNYSSNTSEEATVEAAEDAEAAEPVLSMADVHKDVKTVSTVKKSALIKTSVSEELCLTCHDREQLIEATADCTVLTDAHGTTVNPHDIVAGEQHEGITCESCHIMHASDPAAPYRACVSCHHAEIWECGTCHTYVK